MSWITDCALWEGVTITPPIPGLSGVVAHWDASQASTTTTFIEDLIGTCDLTAVNMNMSTVNGLDIMSSGGSGRMEGTPSPIAGGAQPFGLMIVAKNAGTHTYFNHGSSAGARPHAYTNAGVNRMNAGTNLDDGVSDVFWHVYYFEWNGASSKIYIDGEIDTTGNAGSGAPVGNIVTFLNNQGGGFDSTPATLWAEAKLVNTVQSPTLISGEAQNMLAKWLPYGANAVATGGTITIDTPTLVEHTFLTSGAIRLPSGGSVPIDYLVVGGGGGGGVNMAGGGGAGAVRTGSTTLSATQAITIGGGGAGGTANSNNAVNGSDTVLGSIVTATGGGRGGKGSTGAANGAAGGSGGGGGGNNVGAAGTGGAGGTGGNNGGNGDTADAWGGGGGGGAGAVGSNSSGNNGGAGGAGVLWNGTTYGGGGGGGAASGATPGAGGGGAGVVSLAGATAVAGNGTANTGGGGGGTGHSTTTAGAGGSGIVKIRYDPTAWSP